MNKITIVFDKKNFTPAEGLTSFVGWKRLQPHLNEVVGVSDREVITGIEIDEQGITVRLAHKE